MNANGLAMLADPEPCGHIVFPYSEEAQLIAAVALFASAGLGKTEAVVLVMTPEHKVELRERLKEDGFDVRE
ncbi:MAG TPA: MEDS domain-containing protein, partial [Bryobacteraceae bacterium]|nr:MEDS domain-containing protein [Bryobacteraceae bacterium]